MNDSVVRYQLHPMKADTIGFYDYCVPLTNESRPPTVDSLKKYYDYSIYNYVSYSKPLSHKLITTSVFKPHELRVKHKGSLAINRQSTDWITGVFLLCLMLFALMQKSYPRRLQQIFRATLQPHYVNQLERDGNLFGERITLGLSFIYFSITAIFIEQILKENELLPFGINNILVILGISVGLLLLHVLKALGVFSLGSMFNAKESAHQYQLNTLMFNHFAGIIMLPIAIVSFYSESVEYLIAGSLIIMLIMAYRIIRGVFIGMANKSYSLFYLFLYLCSLEILPILLLYKVISKI